MSDLSKAQQMLAQLQKLNPNAFNEMMDSLEDEVKIATPPGPVPAAQMVSNGGCAGCGGPLNAQGGCPSCMQPVPAIQHSCRLCGTNVSSPGLCTSCITVTPCSTCNGTGVLTIIVANATSPHTTHTAPCPVCQSSAPVPAGQPVPLPDEQLDWSFTKDDMLDLLDLSARDQGALGEVVTMSGAQGLLAESTVSPDEASVTALSTDKWTRRRGKELKKSEWNGIDEHGIGLPKCDEHELADAYAASYEIQPTIAKKFATPEAKLRAQWYESLLKSDDFQSSRNLTVGDIDMADIGAESLSESWVEYRTTITAQQKQEAEEQGLDAVGGPGGVAGKIGLSSSAAKAAAKAAQHIHEAHGGGQGIGLDGQCDGGRKNPKATKKLFSMMKNDRHFRKIMEIAGKMRQVLYAKQGAKLVRGAEEVIDITLSGNLRNVLPSELAKLNGPMRTMTLHKIMSGKVLSRKKASIRPIGKGPIVVYLDESGSMDSSKDQKDPENTVLANGKAMALTMARMAMMQNRWCMLVGFADSHEGNVCVLKPGQWDTEALMEWVEHFYCGGTTLNCALTRGPFGYESVDDNGNPCHVKSYWEEYQIPKGKTDILLITDGVVSVPQEMQDRFNAWKKEEGCKMYSIVIDSDPASVMPVSDQVWKVKSLGVMTDAVAEMCSI